MYNLPKELMNVCIINTEHSSADDVYPLSPVICVYPAPRGAV